MPASHPSTRPKRSETALIHVLVTDALELECADLSKTWNPMTLFQTTGGRRFRTLLAGPRATLGSSPRSGSPQYAPSRSRPAGAGAPRLLDGRPPRGPASALRGTTGCIHGCVPAPARPLTLHLLGTTDCPRRSTSLPGCLMGTYSTLGLASYAHAFDFALVRAGPECTVQGVPES